MVKVFPAPPAPATPAPPPAPAAPAAAGPCFPSDDVDALIRALEQLDCPGAEEAALNLDLLGRMVENAAALAAVFTTVPYVGMAATIAKEIFTMMGRAVRNKELVLMLTVDVALVMEVLARLDGGGGFSDEAKQAFWGQSAGRLHAAVLTHALRRAMKALERALPPSCCGFTFFKCVAAVATAGDVQQHLAAATERLSKARQQFCEALITGKVLSEGATEAVVEVYTRHTRSATNQLRIDFTNQNNQPRRILLYNAETWEEPTPPPVTVYEGKQCMAFSPTEMGRCEQSAACSYKVLGQVRQEPGQPDTLERDAAGELVRPEAGEPYTIVHVCTNHNKTNSLVKKAAHAGVLEQIE